MSAILYGSMRIVVQPKHVYMYINRQALQPQHTVRLSEVHTTVQDVRGGGEGMRVRG